MNFRDFLAFLGTPQSYYPQLSPITGGVTASILFWQLFQWQSQLNSPHLWVRKTLDEIIFSTGLTSSELEFARGELKTRSLLEENITTNTNIIEFRVNVNRLEQLLEQKLSNHPLSNSNRELNNRPTRAPIKTDKYFGSPRSAIAVSVTPHYQFSGPWESREQFEEFQRALLEYAKSQGYENSSAWVFKIIDSITKGIVSPYWDDFIAGKPLGESQKIKRDWEIEKGVPYPAFEEERIQYYIHKGEPLEAAVSKARADLRNPILGKDLWEGFLRKCDRIADDAMKAKTLGVETPYLPSSFRDKPTVTKESVMKKLDAVSPQFSLLPGNEELPQLEEEKSDKEIKIPSLESLQALYKTPLGRRLVEKQIEENPDWGYEVLNGEIVEMMPF
ncbi:MAG: hypothetical protein RLZZ338_4361 [Cyanobacteriota bacterium]|jgi:hypothetical protein